MTLTADLLERSNLTKGQFAIWTGQQLHPETPLYNVAFAFTIEGATEPWGAGFFRLTEGRKRLGPGARVLVTMSSDARYSIEGAPETAFTNPTFKPVDVKYFLKVGSSVWVDFGEARVESVIGSKDARDLLAQPSELIQEPDSIN